MPWGKMDDKFHRNRKVRELRRARGGREALGAWTFWWSWCLDDPSLNGIVPADELDNADLKSADFLVKVGLWDVVEDGYRFHDFEQYNPTRERLDAKRAADRERQAALRAKESPPNPERVASVSQRDNEASPERVASPHTRAGGHARAPQALPQALPDPDQGESAPPPSVPCWQLWAAWERANGGMPMGDRASHRGRLTEAHAACAARFSDPVEAFERAASAFLASKREAGKPARLEYLCTDIAEWLEPRRPNGNGASQVSTEFDETNPSWMQEAAK